MAVEKYTEQKWSIKTYLKTKALELLAYRSSCINNKMNTSKVNTQLDEEIQRSWSTKKGLPNEKLIW